jgi:diguanylate cyclase (GGDEF)-like protein
VDETEASQRDRIREGGLLPAFAHRPAEIWTMVGLDLLGAVIAFAAAFAPFTMHRVGHRAIALAIVFVLLAFCVWISAARLHRLALVVGIVIQIGLISAAITAARTGEGEALVTFAYVWITIYAAAFFTVAELRLVVALIAAGSIGGLAADGIGHWGAVWIIANATTATAAVVVGRSAQALRRDAGTDELTGILNRRGFAQAAAIVRSLTERNNLNVVVAIMDLDDFKALNDAAGHAAGDQALIAATSAWQRELRDGDLLGRFGGDEFVVLLPGVSLAEAEEAIDRLHVAHPIDWTAGCATWDADEVLEECLRRADAQLYARKIEKRPERRRTA